MTPDQELLVTENLPLVYYVFNLLPQFKPYPDREGLIAAGNLGLVKAAKRYNSNLQVTFASHAILIIRGAMIDEHRATYQGSRRMREENSELRAVWAELHQELQRTPTLDDLAKKLNTTPMNIQRIRGEAAFATLLSTDYHPQLLSIIDLNSSGEDPAEVYARTELRAIFEKAIQRLDERRAYVVTEIYFRNRSYKELAQELGVTESRISQILSESAKILRQILQANGTI